MKYNPLELYLIEKITQQGPLSIAEFMEIALSHPHYGYYMKQDPFGVDGDFTTAPEISQMFGEILGVWAANIWMQMGSPASFSFIECGPGRGTLMADMMRGTCNIFGFHKAAKLHLLEISPVLKARQKIILADYQPHWHGTLETLPDDQPIILIANEFLDALPIHQFINGQERKITWSPETSFIFAAEPKGDITEHSPARSSWVEHVCAAMEKTTGTALLIDYGALRSGIGDTLQGVYKHEFISVLDRIGDADLTSHVDFEALTKNIDCHKIKICGPVPQSLFLKNNGIEARAEHLARQADHQQKHDIENALKRLLDSDQMGTLFKVMSLSHGHAIHPAGFAGP